MLQTIHKLYIEPYIATRETKRLKDKETKSLGVNGQWSSVNGQWSTVNGQRDKERKRLRDKGRKNRLFETLILYFLRKISSVDFYLKNIKREGGLLKQEIYLWKSLLRQLVSINGETFLARSAPG